MHAHRCIARVPTPPRPKSCTRKRRSNSPTPLVPPPRAVQVRFLPASGLSAENVSKRTEGGPLSSWYDGPTLLEAIDSFQAAPRATDKAFRMCVADVTSSGKVRVFVWVVVWVGQGDPDVRC